VYLKNKENTALSEKSFDKLINQYDLGKFGRNMRKICEMFVTVQEYFIAYYRLLEVVKLFGFLLAKYSLSGTYRIVQTCTKTLTDRDKVERSPRKR
jgi:predicted nucleotide-binding protein (sugar kinase/HSP70/actin superfamily)